MASSLKIILIAVSIGLLAGGFYFLSLKTEAPNNVVQNPEQKNEMVVSDIPATEAGDVSTPESNATIQDEGLKNDTPLPQQEPSPIKQPEITNTSTIQKPAVISQELQEYLVHIYSFTDWRPTSLTVYVGDTVTFINEDNALHWPGADPHPTHSSLPDFDALGGISRGQSYSHTFRKIGAHGYHDHLLEVPPTIGVITVLPRQ
ncbi:MAG: hypothetical protein HYT93_03150 [Parcubacteria group bacterium]|nr:hypothetical protein [Parcubacteria group bacterium]